MSAALQQRHELAARVHDYYPSRVSREHCIMRRREPVLRGKTGPLNEQQAAHFKKHGYLAVENVFTGEEVAALLQHANRLKKSRADGSDDSELILEPGTRNIRSVFNIHRTDDAFSTLASDARLADIAKQILGSDVYMHQSRINYKPGFHGKEFYWHSDFETWHVEDGMPTMRALSCSVNLTDSTEFNGPLMLIPGSHRYFISCSGETPENHYKKSLRKQEYGVPDDILLRWLADEYGIIAPKGKAGSVVFFDCNIMHGSNSNISPFPRTNLFMVYNSIKNQLVEPFCGLDPRPEFIAARESIAAITPTHPDFHAA